MSSEDMDGYTTPDEGDEFNESAVGESRIPMMETPMAHPFDTEVLEISSDSSSGAVSLQSSSNEVITTDAMHSISSRAMSVTRSAASSVVGNDTPMSPPSARLSNVSRSGRFSAGLHSASSLSEPVSRHSVTPEDTTLSQDSTSSFQERLPRSSVVNQPIDLSVRDRDLELMPDVSQPESPPMRRTATPVNAMDSVNRINISDEAGYIGFTDPIGIPSTHADTRRTTVSSRGSSSSRKSVVQNIDQTGNSVSSSSRLSFTPSRSRVIDDTSRPSTARAMDSRVAVAKAKISSNVRSSSIRQTSQAASSDQGSSKELRALPANNDTADSAPEARKALLPAKTTKKPKEVLSPAQIIHAFKMGYMTKQQSVEALIRYRMNRMLHKNSDRMYVDKDGDVRFVKGYDFGKSRDNRGRAIRRNGLTRIEREIMAYQKSTHLLIPRAVFARVVREIAQHWWRGPEPVKFTVEALSALQAATEDEITRLLEISTACSYHAKRITLRIDDMRLARFCRGRQEYEFVNIKP
ncbi:core histone H2A/H2B/H3/H4 family protein [Babesia bovis T2Bo]|uniref:Core histone H2A/H2B/H3/H4 family protein n=1 Tax=Babesia bovis TaxID=5865 RepID=A7AQ16_BABBO|nr:core histone H2A/H2B/H3/H4 family protein [Babesia bovis T2Bo]EDO08650.1 core histone H2A/H2B/H3/H4 family protein [Babesia bovis T2Bo]|eukprot:XP_001612218.1 core histone H2A/H2B/H3/H4 family protein [Babesia bovis T2Bo]